MGVEMRVTAFRTGISMRAAQSACGFLMAFVLLATPFTGAPRQSKAHIFSVPFVENDYSKALADAQTRNVPIFVDMWAPW